MIMLNENKKFDEIFGEDNFVFKISKDPEEELTGEHYFKLHIDSEKEHHKPHKEVESKKKYLHRVLHLKNKEEKEKKGFKSSVLNVGRQLVASLIIFGVVFVMANWSAYSQIAVSKWQDFWGTKEISPLHKLIDTEDEIVANQPLEVADRLDLEKKKIPKLDIEVMPTDNRIVIPRINQNIPIVNVSSENLIKKDWNALEKDMQNSLKDGVVHYPGTALPGQKGNVAITGHSSYFPWDSGRFKDVFALLHEVQKGDKIVVYYSQEKYIYQVDEIKVVKPNDIDILKQTPGDQLTLITCTPVGTNLNRLVVTAKPIEESKD